MGTILGASYYQLKYCLRNKLRQATGDPDFFTGIMSVNLFMIRMP